MNKRIIIEYLKDIELETCSPTGCPAKEYRDCKICKIHILINKILEEMNGS
jgi:hypothetical protein